NRQLKIKKCANFTAKIPRRIMSLDWSRLSVFVKCFAHLKFTDEETVSPKLRFAPVLCAPIEGGLYSIIDGQHRVHAAAMCGVEAVPCQIVQIDKQEQAASFAAVNGNVTKITAFNLLKAALAAG